MIKLTRLGGEPLVLNADLILYVEARPDTFITLTTGDRLVVTESTDEVVRRAVAYQQCKHRLAPPSEPLPKESSDLGRGWGTGAEVRGNAPSLKSPNPRPHTPNP